jgi:hypothetical protein
MCSVFEGLTNEPGEQGDVDRGKYCRSGHRRDSELLGVVFVVAHGGLRGGGGLEPLLQTSYKQGDVSRIDDQGEINNGRSHTGSLGCVEYVVRMVR